MWRNDNDPARKVLEVIGRRNQQLENILFPGKAWRNYLDIELAKNAIYDVVEHERQKELALKAVLPMRSDEQILTSLLQAARQPYVNDIRLFQNFANLAGRLRNEDHYLQALNAMLGFTSISSHDLGNQALLGLTAAFLDIQTTPDWLEIANYEEKAEDEGLESGDEEFEPFLLMETDTPSKDTIEIVRLIDVELIKYLQTNPNALDQFRPRQFEELIAEVLAGFGWEVTLTPETKDGGYDIYGISKDEKSGAKTSWLIECKKYAPENKVGVEIARALYGVKTDKKVANAMIATTSYYTRGVQEFTASRYDFDLKNRADIFEWLNIYIPHPEGRLYIKDQTIILPWQK